MRLWILSAALVLAACGDGAPPPATPPEQPPAAVAQPLTPGEVSGPVTAFGAAPDWRLTIEPASGLRLEDIAGGTVVTAPTVAPTIGADGRAAIAAGAMTITLERGPCTSGSRSNLPMIATVSIADGASYTGCAYQRWDHELAALLPAIDACLAAQPTPAAILYAGRDAEGATLVRLGPPQGRIDCRVPAGGGTLINTPADETLALPSQADPIFHRAPGENPGGECYVAPEVRAPSGQLLGWYADPAGC
ncbi:MAG: hypothetical protein GC189_13635 [Alphaproteobacteria bacterium]|nr:hypothetical protein [Alphaproteobacteria bacterium]